MTDLRRRTALDDAVRECRPAVLLLGGFGFFVNLLVLASPLYMMQIFDRVLASGRIETLVFLTAIAAFALLVMALIETVRARLLGRIAGWLDRRLSPELIAAAVRGAAHGRQPTVQPLRDLGAIRSFIASPAPNALLDAPWVPVFLCVLWLLHPWLGLLGMAAAAVLLAGAMVNELLSRGLLRRADGAAIAGMAAIDSAVRNADSLLAMGMLPQVVGSWDRRNGETLAAQLTAGDRNAAVMGFSRFFRAFVQVAVLGVGAWLVLAGELTAGGMIAGSILLGRALAPVEQAIGSWKTLAAARAAVARLRRLLAETPPPPRTMPLPDPQGRLSCERLVYVPEGRERPVIDGLGFELRPGEALAVIGPSAAGKSSLCRLLVGARAPSAGHVRLDGADLSAWPPEQLGRHVGYLPQDVELFAGSIRQNIARFAECADPVAVVEAARMAGVHEMVLALPEGYETEVGERGCHLSGGQRQRIGLARALFGRPRVLVLDEPNAGLDHEGEQALAAAIAGAKDWGAAVVLVAHHPRIIEPCDRILLLKGGQAELLGRRDEVMSRLREGGGSGQPPRPGGVQVIGPKEKVA